MMNDGVTFLGERLDDLQIKGYHVIQKPGCFCFGMDSVLLSAFAKARKGESVLDMGTGTGILPLLMEAKYPGECYVGLEIQKESVDAARRSVRYNGLEEKIRIVEGDICNASGIFGQGRFEVVTVNPPYMPDGHGVKNEKKALYIAKHEVSCTLEDVLRESAKVLKVKGRFYMVHRPFRLAEILSGMHAYGLEPKRMRMVHPYPEKKPSIVLLEGQKGGKPGLDVEPPLMVWEKSGEYTEEVKRIYHL